MPFNSTAKNVMLDALDETASQITHIAIHQLTTAPAADGSPGVGVNANLAAAPEAVGGGYARQAVAWGAAAGELKTNTGALTFDVAAGTYAFFGQFNALTGNTNNYRGYTPFGGAAAIKGFGTVDAADVIANAITSSAHGLVNTDRVVMLSVFAESLPGGVTEGAIYFVVGATTDTFQLALTSGGAAVDITSIGELYFQKTVPEVFAAPGQITVAVGALALDLTGV